MTQQPATSSRPGAGRRAAGAVVVALAVANGLGYLLTLVASRRLGPEGYGALAALLGLVLVGNVLALALQAVVARRTVVTRVAHGGAGGQADPRWASTLTVRAATAAVVVGLVVAAPVTELLHLDSPAPAVLLALTLGPLTMVGGQLGVLQGLERFPALAALYLLAGVGKVGGGVAGVLLTDSVAGTMAGTALGAALAAGAGAWLVARETAAAPRSAVPPSGLARETARATYCLGALFALANLDVVLARHFLTEHDAGLYAVGAVIAKGAFWLPSFVPVIALPGLADPARRRRTVAFSLGTVTGAGLLVTVVTAALGSLVLRLIGGSAYTSLADRAWLFAATGALLAVVQLLVYSRLAAEDGRAAVPVWLVVGAEVATIWTARHGSVTAVVTTALGAAAVAALLGLLAELHEHGLVASRGLRPAAAEGGR